jgi:glycosyltransferase involved in cell wall biosynthesis
MPKIAFILEAFYGDQIGGAERQVQMLADALRNSRGWLTVYICQRPSGKPRREHVEGMEVFSLPPRKRRVAWLNYRELHRAMEESEADIFYQRVRHPYTGLTAMTARRLGKPMIFAAASRADVYREKDLRWSSHAGNPLDVLLHPVGQYFGNQGILNADAVILQTEEQRRLLWEQYRRNGVVIPNHIVIGGETQPAKRDPPEVLWISNVKPFKRPELFIDLARRCADLNVSFVMIGDCSNDGILKTLQRAEKEIAHFAYLGPLHPQEAEKRIAAAALLVNTSEFEGFPNAFQQAWAHGVPTFSLGVDPDGVIAREGLGGCLKSLDELERAVRGILYDKEALSSVSARAKDFARRTYDLKNLLPRYLELFEGLL